METFSASKLGGLPAVANAILEKAGSFRLFAFYGEMGAGKTTLILEMLKIMGVQYGSSPTYSIVNEYQTKTGEPVYHFDFYRINSLEEAYDIGYETYFFSGQYCFVEWPEKIAELLPEDAVKIILKVRDEGREILLELPESW